MNRNRSSGPRRVFLVVLGLVLGLFVVVRSADLPLRSILMPAQTRLSPDGELTIVRSPGPAKSLLDRGALAALPRYDARSAKGWQVDLRARDLRSLDLSQRLGDLRHADFDSRTRWPSSLPADFDPAGILSQAKNPGLGVRRLHARGITGTGIGLGIIDQQLLVDHVEYRERLRSYQEIHIFGEAAQMHGPAVASFAVGKSVGVAPGADLYYIANGHGTYDSGQYVPDFSYVAAAIDRLVAINGALPANRKLRVISISVGWSLTQKGYAEVMAAVKRATAANVFVISTALTDTHGLSFHGLGRDQTADPDVVESYRPGSWWAASFWSGMRRFQPSERLLVPMDARTAASPAGSNEYVYYSDGGWSWSVPWIAGLYALACQVRPTITPEAFWREALATGKTIRLRREQKEVDFGTIADPVALMARLQSLPRVASRPEASRAD